MPVQHHDLAHEFPQLKEQIHNLKTSDPHFKKLFDEYHELTKKIESMETEALTVSTAEEEKAKMHRVHLKDKLYSMLTRVG